MAVTWSPHDFRIIPMLLAMIPLPTPEITPPVTRMYFIGRGVTGYQHPDIICLLSARGLRAPGVGARPAAAGLGLQAGTARERTKAPGLGARRPSARAASYQRSGGGARKLAGGDGGLRPTAGPRSPVGQCKELHSVTNVCGSPAVLQELQACPLVTVQRSKTL